MINNKAAGYKDYGSMYSLADGMGLYEKPQTMSMYNAGNDVNAQGPNGFSLPASGNPRTPQPQIMAQPQSLSSHTNEGTDYSIDSVRSTGNGMAQYGGKQGQKRRVRVTPPQQPADGQQSMMAYGGNIPGTYNQFDTRWNPVTFQGQIGINPNPNPFDKVKKTLPEASPDQANVNAEKNEQVLGNFTPDGLPSLMDVNGPPHTAGGKDISVPDGSFIFSDTPKLKIKDPEVLKVFGQSKPGTPADLAKKYDLQKFTKVLADPHADNVAKKTAELMVGNMTSKLNQLAAYQESMKNSMGIGDNQPQQQPIAQYGGDQTPKIPYLNSFPNDDIVVTDKKSPQWQAPITGGGQDTPDVPDFQQMVPRNLPPLPTNISDPTDPEHTLGSYNKTNNASSQTNVPFTAPTPDKWGIANSLLNAATIHRYPAWEAPIGAVTPNTVFEDPTRALAELHEQSNAAGYNAALSGNSRAARANAMSYQNADQVANVLGSVANRNVQTSNQASREAADISNKLQQEQAQRLNRMYQGNVISAQQYDNALRESRNDVVKQQQTAFNDRSKMSFLNATSPYFYVDPVTGARGFKSKEAEAKFHSEVDHLSLGTGISSDTLSKYKTAYDAAIIKGVLPERADKYAAEASGMTDREREKLNQVGIMQSETVSRSAVEKFGGAIKKKQYRMGGMTPHQLSKFIRIPS
jgi:hypothetical protein